MQRSMRRRKRDAAPRPRFRPEADPALASVFSRIGKPPASTPFVPDAFQIEALEAIDRSDCLVIAPTGSGKTWIAREAMQAVFGRGGRSWYASPLKALSNAKWVEFGEHFSAHNVGILTGDTKDNPDAPILVGTTEILRNQLYDVMHEGGQFPCDLVILDECHFLGDPERGVVWEEIMIYLPARVHLLLLSATIGNGEEIAEWLQSIRGKACAVVRETRRPVPLHPLFLHPSGRLAPYLTRRQLARGIESFSPGKASRRGPWRQHAPFGHILQALATFDLLPAIFFLKSRAECNSALRECRPLREPTADKGAEILEEHLAHHPYLRHHPQLAHLTESRVAAHHGGQLPAWKFLVEAMMQAGRLRAIFATSTVAAGVNFPARTIVLLNSDHFNGHAFEPLTGTEFHQMTGRAGRRGLDRVGFLLVLPGRFLDVHHIRKMLLSRPEEIRSQIRNDFSMVLNLLLSQTPEDIRTIFERSLAAYQEMGRKRRKKQGVATSAGLWEDFSRHLAFLKAEGFVDDKDRLTADGRWASRLRLDHPLLIAEGLRQGAFPRSDERLLAAAIAPFVYDGDQELDLPPQAFPRKLREAQARMQRALAPIVARLQEQGFAVYPFKRWTAAVLYAWAAGRPWNRIIAEMGIADGDLAMLVFRTADNLRQMSSLRDAYPDMAELAQKAREAILREPVVIEP